MLALNQCIKIKSNRLKLSKLRMIKRIVGLWWIVKLKNRRKNNFTRFGFRLTRPFNSSPKKLLPLAKLNRMEKWRKIFKMKCLCRLAGRISWSVAVLNSHVCKDRAWLLPIMKSIAWLVSHLSTIIRKLHKISRTQKSWAKKSQR